MATFIVTDPQTGKKLRLTGDSPPTEQELEQIFASQAPQEAAQPVQQQVAPVAQRPEQPQIEQPPQQTPFLDKPPPLQVEGATEAALSLGTSFVAEPLAGLAGIAGSLLPGEPGQGAEFVEKTREALTFQPRSEAGQQLLGGAGELLSKDIPFTETSIPEGFQTIEKTLGDAAFGLSEDPQIASALAAAATTAPTAALEALGIVGLNKIRGPRKITGIPDSVDQSLKTRGIDVEKLPDADIKQIKKEVGEVLKANKERITQLEQAGLQPTRAQVTRSADDFQRQQELTKTDTPVRQALEEQEGLLANQFDESVAGTGGEAVTSGSSVSDVIINRSTKLDNEISQLYKEARDLAPGEKNVKPDKLGALLKSRAKSDSATNGLISSVVGEMETQGILDGFKVVGKVDVDTAENLRKFINTHFNSTTDFGRGILRDMKEALDEDVFKNAGKDVFGKARKAKSDFEKSLNRAKVSKFDSRNKNLVRDILENKIDPDDLAQKITQSKSFRSEDLKQVKDFLTQDPPGRNAFNDLRAEVMQSIKEKAFIGPEDAAGNKALSRNALEKVLSTVGESRLKVLFNEAERKFLDTMVNVSKIREPVRGTALGQGPSAQAIKALERNIVRNPLISEIFKGLTETITEGRRSKAALTLPPTTANVRTTLRTVPSAIGTAAPVLITRD